MPDNSPQAQTPHPPRPRDARYRLTNPFHPVQPGEVNSSIPARFSRIAAEHSDRLAVKTVHTALSYGELDYMSDCIAGAIIDRRGVCNEPVALMLSDDGWTIAAIFGVLKAGGFYVPMDPAQASARDRYILRDCGAQIIITSGQHLPLASDLSAPSGHIVVSDEIDLSVRRTLPDITIPPQAIAFIVYTSGSTGEPKGVIQTHRNILDTLKTGTNLLRINSDDRITLISAFTTGAGVTNTYCALLNGACLFPIRVNRDGIAAVRDVMIDEGITVYHSVPSVFRYLAGSLSEKMNAPALRVIKLGGEVIHRTDVELYRKYFPDTALLNVVYGATEMNVIRRFFADKDTEIEGDVVPIGYETDSTKILIVDSAGDPLPPDCTGEILIRSDFVSPGYWGKPDLTARSFVPDPEFAGCTAYSPGDLGRMSQDGRLFHLGRKDFLVKVRGSGVDINELERNLLDIEGVGQAAVIVTAAPDGSNALTAFASKEPLGNLTENYLRAEIRKRLPDSMAPARFIICDKLPSSVGGKMDRRALRELAAAPQPSRTSPTEPPHNALEERLCVLWKVALGLDTLGVADDFFSLGGHSLMVARLVAEINREFGTTLRPSSLLQAPTIRRLALAISQPDLSAETSVVAINPSGESPPFFCVHGVGGEVLAFRQLANYLGPNHPFYALRALPTIGDNLRVEDIAERYVHDIQRIDPTGPYRL
ncbi:MAG TPA: AMP-binding protein, partial [Blastocatellia bacterium]|nr:AMP-binding protein [Blastocatellia bacterium]